MIKLEHLNGEVSIIREQPRRSYDSQTRNLWYVARTDEILVDMDKPATSLPHTEMRLRGAIASGLIDIERIELHRSFTPSHLHMLVTLDKYFFSSSYERVVWSLMFHSDIYRACNTIMRINQNINAPDLLITPVAFQRPPDATCECDQKHTGPVMDVCPAAIALRGEDRTRSFFGKPVRAELENRVFPENGDFRMFDANVLWTGRHFS